MTDDPFRWLEDLDGDAAAAWVRERNAESLGRLTGDARFARLRDELLAVLDSTDRIPYPSWHDGHLYNLWKDRDHPRGRWRRTTLAEYRTDAPDWEILIDVDALAAREDENWIWQDANLLRPAGRRALVRLSRGGSSTSTSALSSRTASRCPRRRARWAGSTPTGCTWVPTSDPVR